MKKYILANDAFLFDGNKIERKYNHFPYVEVLFHAEEDCEVVTTTGTLTMKANELMLSVSNYSGDEKETDYVVVSTESALANTIVNQINNITKAREIEKDNRVVDVKEG